MFDIVIMYHVDYTLNNIVISKLKQDGQPFQTLRKKKNHIIFWNV